MEFTLNKELSISSNDWANFKKIVLSVSALWLTGLIVPIILGFINAFISPGCIGGLGLSLIHI